jgi:hypothetical protein
MFGLGQAIGNIPGQLEQRRQKDTEAGMLAGLTPGSVDYNEQLMKIYEERGELDKAANLGVTVQQQKRESRQRTGSSQAVITDIQSILADLQGKTDKKSKAQKEEALSLLRNAAVAGEDASESFSAAVQSLRSRVQDQQFTPAKQADLAKTFKPESVADFIKSGDVKDLELRDPKTGSLAAPSFQTLFNEEEGKNEVFAVWRDAAGEIQKKLVGVAEAEEEEAEEDDAFDKRWASNLLEDTRTKAREAGQDAAKYSQLASEAANREFYERGFFGKALSATEEAVGLAGSATTHRRRINEVRMSGALNLLPKGPASDRDVQLAMDASIDPNNLTNEEAESYLRGMEKIARLEEEYYSLKLQYMQDANDPNAIGFEDLVAKKAAENGFNELKNNAPASTQAFQEKIKQANALTDPAEREAALKELEMLFPNAFELLSNLNAATERWNNTVKRNPNLQGIS